MGLTTELITEHLTGSKPSDTPTGEMAKAEEFIASVKEIDAITARLRTLLAEPLPDDENWNRTIRIVAGDLRIALVETFDLPPLPAAPAAAGAGT